MEREDIGSEEGGVSWGRSGVKGNSGVNGSSGVKGRSGVGNEG